MKPEPCAKRLIMDLAWVLIHVSSGTNWYYEASARALKNVDLWTRQRPDDLEQPIESSRGCLARLQKMIGRKEKVVLHLLSLAWGSLQVLKMVPIKTNWQ